MTKMLYVIAPYTLAVDDLYELEAFDTKDEAEEERLLAQLFQPENHFEIVEITCE